jgi:hypothetical protein
MKTFCNKCGLETNQNIVFEIEKTIFFDPDEDFIINCYQVIECKGCNNIAYRTLTRDRISTDNAINKKQSPWKMVERFPHSEKNYLRFENRQNLPHNLNVILSETISSFNNNNYILCAAGLRAILETIFSDQIGSVNGKYGTLEKKIFALGESGILTKNNSQILQDLRFIGNKAIHELRVPSEKELRIALEIIEITLDTIYAIRSKRDNLKNIT